jgi:hypothetical protein
MSRHTFRLLALACLGLTIAAVCPAQNAAHCRDVQFSADVLARFPRIAETCLDVITRDGQHYAVIKAQLQDVRGNTLRVKVKMPDGSYSDSMSVQTKPDLRLLIEGKPARVSELAHDQELTAYVRVDRPMIAIAPASESEPLDPVPLAAPEPALARTEPVMPHTAGSLGFLALWGQFCFAMAMAVNIARRSGR